MTLTTARPLAPAVRASLAPNWFACVMGTGIVAVAASSLPVRIPGLRDIATTVWALAAVLLAVLLSVWVSQRAHRSTGHLDDPVLACFYGAPPMAMLTVGAGALLLGRDVVGLPAALTLDWVLWSAGTASGLLVAVVVPYRRRRGGAARMPFGGWLMPVVPPMVSASTGALLVPHTPAGAARVTLLLSCYAMFVLALVASAVVIATVWRRVAVHGPGEPRTVPTLWIVLGPLGQSVTAANLLGGVASLALPAPDAAMLRSFGVAYGLPVLGLALLWAGVAGTITVRTARAGLPFSPAWWSFTFPVGTCVTATSALALHTGSGVLRWAAVLLYAALVAAWVVVATVTVVDVAPTELLGSWTLQRRVHDRVAGIRGRVSGTVEFVADGDAVRWVERGVLSWDGRRLDVARELRVVPAPGGWLVRFDDGRDFHPWTPDRVVTHPCRADVYRGLVRVDDSRTRLRVLWDVTGPAKDQRLITRCRRTS